MMCKKRRDAEGMTCLGDLSTFPLLMGILIFDIVGLILIHQNPNMLKTYLLEMLKLHR